MLKNDLICRSGSKTDVQSAASSKKQPNRSTRCRPSKSHRHRRQQRLPVAARLHLAEQTRPPAKRTPFRRLVAPRTFTGHVTVGILPRRCQTIIISLSAPSSMVVVLVVVIRHVPITTTVSMATPPAQYDTFTAVTS